MGDSRRSYGTGTLYRRADTHGREWWYGRWHNGASRPNRKIGPIRTRGSEEGLANEYEFVILNIRQAALENEADAARLVEELAAELGIEGAWERTEITNVGAEGTEEAIRFPAVSQAALKAAVDGSPNREEVARSFLVPTP